MTDKANDSTDRRDSERIPTEMWVEQSTSREVYFQRGSNLSTGGIYLEHTIPMPKGTEVRLVFTLPGDDEALEVKGIIVNIGESVRELGMGVKFVDLPETVRLRIEAFIQRTLDPSEA